MVFVPRTWVVGEVVTAALMNQEIRDGFNSTLQETMAWTAISSLGSFGTNFSAGVLTPRMRKYRQLAVEVWEFEGIINTSSFAASTVHTMFTFNTGYRPGKERGFSTYGAGTIHYPVRVGFQTSGALHGSVPSAVGSGTTSIWLDGCRITDPLRT